MNDIPAPARSPKPRSWHTSRAAVVYIRQSTPQQVLDHRESTARQHALADRAVELGWARDQVVIIDDDLGKSGQSAEGRPGFQLNRGKWNKALRGEIYGLPPIGYLRGPSGAFEIDPDEQVQATVRLVFDEFDRQGTLHGLLRYLVHHGILMPVRVYRKGQRERLEWRRPNRETLQNLLHHPAYAGAYRYGHRPTDPRRKIPGRPTTGRLIRPAEQCAVLIRDHVPAYIGWERFESNQRTLAENRARSTSRGAPRPGPSLLGGLLVCGRCGRRMMARYSGKDGVLRYDCARGSADYAEPLCQTTPGRLLDELVAGRILAAITPAALEASLAAVADVEQQRRPLAEQWRTRLERARYDTERAARQFHAVEPENRLVGRELERRWEEALKNEQSLRCEHEKSMRDLPASLTEAERAEVLALASDLPALWKAETTTAPDRQRIARLLLERAVVEVLGKGDQVDVRLEWVGGFVSAHRVVKAVSRYDQKSDWPRLKSRLGELHQGGLSAAEIAASLNREGFRPPKRAERFQAGMIHRLLSDCGLTQRRPTPDEDRTSLGPDEWFLSDLAAHLAIPEETMHRRRRVGWIHARKRDEPRGRWILWADAAELERLRRLRSCPRTWDNQPLDRVLIIPKPRTDRSDATD